MRDKMAGQTSGLSPVSGGSVTVTAPDGHLAQAVWTELMTGRTWAVDQITFEDEPTPPPPPPAGLGWVFHTAGPKDLKQSMRWRGKCPTPFVALTWHLIL